MASTNCALFSLGLLVLIQKVTSQSNASTSIASTSTAAVVVTVCSPSCPSGFTMYNNRCFMVMASSTYFSSATSCQNQAPSLSSATYYSTDQASFYNDITHNGLFAGKSGFWYGVKYNAWQQAYLYADDNTVASGEYNDPASTTTWSSGAPNASGIAVATADNTTICVQMNANSNVSDGFLFTLVSCDGNGTLMCFTETIPCPTISTTSVAPVVVPVFVKTTTVQSEMDYILQSFQNGANSNVQMRWLLALIVALTSGIMFSS